MKIIIIILHVVYNNCLVPVMILVLWAKAKKGEKAKRKSQREQETNTKELLEREDCGDIIYLHSRLAFAPRCSDAD